MNDEMPSNIFHDYKNNDRNLSEEEEDLPMSAGQRSSDSSVFIGIDDVGKPMFALSTNSDAKDSDGFKLQIVPEARYLAVVDSTNAAVGGVSYPFFSSVAVGQRAPRTFRILTTSTVVSDESEFQGAIASDTHIYLSQDITVSQAGSTGSCFDITGKNPKSPDS